MIVDLSEYSEVAGVCDLLRQVTFCAAVAKIRGEGRLQVRQAVSVGCPDPMVELFELEGFEMESWMPEVDSEAEWKMNSYNSLPNLKMAEEVLGPGVLGKDVGASEFLAHWRHAYTWILPLSAVREMLDGIGAGDDCLGLHVRVTDKVTVNPSPFEITRERLPVITKRTLKAVLAQLKALKLKKVFLACDDVEAKQVWEELLADRGIEMIFNESADFDPSRLRQTSGRAFMIDLFGLASCRAIVGSINSGVPVTAALIGGKPVDDILWGRYYQPILSLSANRSAHRARREAARDSVNRGINTCPTFAFLDEEDGGFAGRFWLKFAPDNGGASFQDKWRWRVEWAKDFYRWNMAFPVHHARRERKLRAVDPRRADRRDDLIFDKYRKVLVIRINHSYAGLFAYFIFALNQLRYAERKGYFPVVHFGRDSGDGENAYFDEEHGDNLWDYYFEPVAGVTYGRLMEMVKDPDEPIREEDLLRLPDDYLTWLHMWNPRSVYGYAYGFQSIRPGYRARWFARQRSKARHLVERYVKVKGHVLKIVDDFEAHWMDGHMTIGVHIRGTDKGAAVATDSVKNIVGVRSYFERIDDYRTRHPDCRIFVATDQEQYLEAMIERYGERVIHYDAQRSTNHLNPFQLKDGRGYEKGEEALVDCLLLSRCDLLLKCTSHLSETSMYFNAGLECVDMNYLGGTESANPYRQPGEEWKVPVHASAIFKSEANAFAEAKKTDQGETLIYKLGLMEPRDWKGFHHPELHEGVPYRWSGRIAKVRLRLRRRDYKLDVYMRPLHHLAGELKRASVNGNALGPPSHKKDGKVTFRVPGKLVSRLGSSWLELEFEAPESSELPDSNARELGAPLFKVKLRPVE